MRILICGPASPLTSDGLAAPRIDVRFPDSAPLRLRDRRRAVAGCPHGFPQLDETPGGLGDAGQGRLRLPVPRGQPLGVKAISGFSRHGR